MQEEERFELEENVAELENQKARHTELITVYVPAGYDLNNIQKQLEQEKSTAANIKSKSTQKNVIDALESIIRKLKLTKGKLENGLAIFAGNVAEREGQKDLRLWMIEPPKKLGIRLYRCDQKFVLEPLKEMLEVSEVYGLVVIDRNEATIGLLEGKQIKKLQHMTSGVPGKTEKGGQCLSPDTLIMKYNGEIVQLRESHNPMMIVSENFNSEKSEVTPLITKWENEKQLFKVKTKNPVLEIKSSGDHLFFVRTENGIEEKPLSQIKKGDFLLSPSKIDLHLEKQTIEFEFSRTGKIKKVRIPKFLERDLARIFGYYLGDGCYYLNRISFFEQRKEVSDYYEYLAEKTFGMSCKLKFRKDKNYYEIRIYSKIIANLFKKYFTKSEKTLVEEIPKIILRSPDEVLASFIGGFFDAEGYVSSSRIGCGINNKIVARQIQMALLRLGIISSILEYDNKRNPYSINKRYTIEISCIESMKKFLDKISFVSSDKNKKLKKIIKNRGNQDQINQIIVNGKEIARIIKNSGYVLEKFNCRMFFLNKRQMSRQVFKRRILDKIENLELKSRLEFLYNSNLIITKVNKIIPLELNRTIDIETKSHNFLANGLIVHNSAARYARIREGMAKEFFRRVSEAVKNNFFDMKKLKAILVGGPGPTKEDFLKEGNLVTALKEKIIAVKDIGYADEHGLELLVETSQDVLSKQEIIHEKKLLEDFFNNLGKHPEKTAYGLERVNKALEVGAVGTLIIDKKLGRKQVNELEAKAKNIAAKVELVSEETEEGQQFKNLGGIGALLRFQIQ